MKNTLLALMTIFSIYTISAQVPDFTMIDDRRRPPRLRHPGPNGIRSPPLHRQQLPRKHDLARHLRDPAPGARSADFGGLRANRHPQLRLERRPLRAALRPSLKFGLRRHGVL